MDQTTLQLLRKRHVLFVDADIEPSDILALVRSRYAKAQLKPAGPSPRSAPRKGGSDAGDPPVELKLSRYSTLSGPYPIDAEAGRALGLTEADAEEYAFAFALDAPRDRESAPPPEWLVDADGLNEAFPEGLPNKEEERMISLLLDVARRLHLSVRLADEPGARPNRILTPDPGRSVDYFIYSAYWLAPDALESLIRSVEPGAAMQGGELAPGATDAADEPVTLDGFAIEIPFEEMDPAAGSAEVRVIVAEVLPDVVAAHLPAQTQQVEYHVHWMDRDEKRFLPGANAEFRELRAAAANRVERVAKAVMQGTAGIGMDENGFLVAAHQLQED